MNLRVTLTRGPQHQNATVRVFTDDPRLAQILWDAVVTHDMVSHDERARALGPVDPQDGAALAGARGRI